MGERVVPSSQSHSREVTPAHEALPSVSLETRISALFNVVPVPSDYAEFARSSIAKMDCREVLIGVTDATRQLEQAGFSTEEQYFQSRRIPGAPPLSAPLATITATNESGEYGFPNTNLLLHAVGMRENGADESSTKRETFTSSEREEAPENRYRIPPEVEGFSAPVRILVELSDDPQSNFHLQPIFSDTAYLEARVHAAQVIRDQANSYSFVLDEVIVPALTAYLHEWNPVHFGERELPRYFNQGTDARGEKFKVQVETLDPEENLTRLNLTIDVDIDSEGRISATVLPNARP